MGDLIAWLRALANPLDELALYSTLASPLVGVSSDGLALIAFGELSWALLVHVFYLAALGTAGVWVASRRLARLLQP